MSNKTMHDDISYKYRADEKSLLRKVLEGTLDEDVYIHSLTPTKVIGRLFDGVDRLDIRVIGNLPNEFFDYSPVESIVVRIDTSGNANLRSVLEHTGGTKRFEVIFGNDVTSMNTHTAFTSNTTLETLIVRAKSPSFGGSLTGTGPFAQSNSVLKTIVLDTPSVCALTGNLIVGIYGQNGTGGTIYIPKALYDHLGDGSDFDYKAATNWSTYDSYGTITWAQIEGSEYEET